MKNVISFFSGSSEKATISGFESFALSSSAMFKVRGGDGGPTSDIWIPDEEKTIR